VGIRKDVLQPLEVTETNGLKIAFIWAKWSNYFVSKVLGGQVFWYPDGEASSMEFRPGVPPGYLEMKWSWHWNPCQHILPVLHIIIHFYFLFSSYHAALVFACRNVVLVTQFFPLPLTDVPLLYSVPGFDIWSSLTTRTVFTHYLGITIVPAYRNISASTISSHWYPFRWVKENSRLSWGCHKD
jgi:hypothetical protein